MKLPIEPEQLLVAGEEEGSHGRGGPSSKRLYSQIFILEWEGTL